MGSRDLQKRLTTLKKQADLDRRGRISFFRAFCISIITLWFIISILPPSRVNRVNTNTNAESENSSTTRLLQRLRGTTATGGSSAVRQARGELEQRVVERVEWLKSAPFRSGAGNAYFVYSKGVLEAVLPTTVSRFRTEDIVDFSAWTDWLAIRLASVFLRLGFLLIGFWPLWVIGAVIGAFVIPPKLRPKPTVDLLGIGERGAGPFYSGIYGPLRPNNGLSGTDLSVPGLACPAAVTPAVANNHRLIALLKKHGALNETTLGLVQIILAYQDFPAFVEEERNSEEAAEELTPAEGPTAIPRGKLIAVPTLTIEKASLEGLEAVLTARRILAQAIGGNSAKNQGEIPRPGTAEFAQLTKGASELSRILLGSLTAARAQALSRLPANLVAASYLATEAGKSLVFKRIDRGFAQISRYPHLQARAVLHSLPSYHREFNGDARLVVRQAIIGSRRHGDFGRPFLPTNMPVASRALRDWLEVMYAEQSHRADTAHLVELDSHLEEIHFNFRAKFMERLRQEAQQREQHPAKAHRYAFWKGIPYKSVVLMPLTNLVEIALHGMDERRRVRVSELIRETRKLQSSMSISARLPGFKRQAVEAEQTTLSSEEMNAIFNSSESGKNVLERWFILRRMLTRYNWLSTRVGDYNVPVDGLIHSVVIDRGLEKIEVIGLDTLVPLRQRRFREMAGISWERGYYGDAPHPDDLSIFIDHSDFRDALKRKIEDAKKGLLDLVTRVAASNAPGVG